MRGQVDLLPLSCNDYESVFEERKLRFFYLLTVGLGACRNAKNKRISLALHYRVYYYIFVTCNDYS